MDVHAYWAISMVCTLTRRTAPMDYVVLSRIPTTDYRDHVLISILMDQILSDVGMGEHPFKDPTAILEFAAFRQLMLWWEYLSHYVAGSALCRVIFIFNDCNVSLAYHTVILRLFYKSDSLVFAMIS